MKINYLNIYSCKIVEILRFISYFYYNPYIRKIELEPHKNLNDINYIYSWMFFNALFYTKQGQYYLECSAVGHLWAVISRGSVKCLKDPSTVSKPAISFGRHIHVINDPGFFSSPYSMLYCFFRFQMSFDGHFCCSESAIFLSTSHCCGSFVEIITTKINSIYINNI